MKTRYIISTFVICCYFMISYDSTYALEAKGNKGTLVELTFPNGSPETKLMSVLIKFPSAASPVRNVLMNYSMRPELGMESMYYKGNVNLVTGNLFEAVVHLSMSGKWDIDVSFRADHGREKVKFIFKIESEEN